MFGRIKNDEAVSFTNELKKLGVKIDNEFEFVDRISEVSAWKNAFQIILKHADRFSIKFNINPEQKGQIHQVFAKYELVNLENLFYQNLVK